MGLDRAEPDPFSASTQAEFRQMLRELMRWAGYATLRPLSEAARQRGVDLPITTVSGALKNDALPTEDFVRRMATTCGVDQESWIRSRQALEDVQYARGTPAPDDRTPEVLESDDCPYPGLASFTSDDEASFFGRESDTATLLDLLGQRLESGGILIVGGPSGAGKSSLLRAGLFPALAKGRLPGSRRWTRLIRTPGDNPISRLAELLRELPGVDALGTDELAARLRHDPELAATTLRQALSRSSAPAAIIVIDQFEELFTLGETRAEHRLFVRALHAVAQSSGGVAPAALIVLGVRADQYAGFADHPELTAALRHGHLMLGPMSRAELVAAIERPAQVAGLGLDGGLTEVLLGDLGVIDHRDYPAGSLPLLAQALRNTWQQRDGRLLTVAGYRLTGGISGAIGHTAQRAYDGLDAAQRGLARSMLIRMVQIGETTAHARRQVNAAELVATSADPPGAQGVLDTLIRYRLVSVIGADVEIVHEALLRAWQRLRTWIEDDRAGLLLEQRLIESAQQWDIHGRHESELYRGPRLAEIADRVGARPAHNPHGSTNNTQTGLPTVAGEFLRASLEHEHEIRQRERRGVRILRALVGVLGGLLLISIAATGITVGTRVELVAQRDAAQSRELAGTALALRTVEPSVAAQLALVAYQKSPTAEARGALISSLSYVDPVRWSNSDIGDAVRTVAFSGDGKLLAAASQDHFARVWRFGAQPSLDQRPLLLPHPDQVRVAQFSPDNRWLATSSNDHAVRLWPVDSLERNPVPIVLPGAPRPLAFSHDSRLLATGLPGRNTVRLWGLATDPAKSTAAVLGELPEQDAEVLAAAIDLTGRLLATAGTDGIARLWDITDPAAPTLRYTLTENAGVVYTVAFSPDGRLLATGHSDKTARLWDVHDPGAPVELPPLRGHLGGVFGVAFSPDGHTLATASDDTTARLWDITNPAGPVPLATPLAMDADNVYSVAFSPDGHTLASASHGRTVRLWETDINRVTAEICRLSPINQADWQRYLHDQDYQPPCSQHPEAHPTADPAPLDSTTLMAAHSHRCLASNPNEPSSLRQGHCGDPGTYWQMRRGETDPVPSEDVHIVNHATGLCLDASDDNSHPGTASLVQQRTCEPNAPAQLWRPIILARHTDTVDVHLINQRDPSQRACMDVSGDSTADDAHLILWPCGNRTKQNQLFTMSTTAVDR